ncbi:MAG TPA: sulfatase-like hydrolase/transferase [Burkholderiales bacterium]
MPLAPKNLLVVMSDEHSPRAMGVAAHALARTPNLDRLAARGTRFTSAYTSSPICVPARAAFATGKYQHQVGYWDNADAYDGAVPSWHHLLRERGHRVVSIGKLHFRGLPGDDHGFSEEIVPMHVIEGLGDVKGLVRTNIPRRKGYRKLAELAGPGESPYTRYDRDIAARARAWLRDEAPKHRDRPWALFVSFVCPHFPLVAPQQFFDLYPPERIPLPKQYRPAERPDHPYLREYHDCVGYDDGFDGDDCKVRRAIAGYLGLVSFMDDNVGAVLRALEDCGLAADTRVVYTSDHGDNAGARGLWGKSTMYEESAGVPLILAGPGVAMGARCATPVSHVDLFPFFLEAAGAPLPHGDYRGVSPLALASGAQPGRAVLSEYHAIGSTGGVTMLRQGRWKYVHYVRYRPQLFDLESDPEELVDVAGRQENAAVLAALKAELLRFCDPDEVDARAKRRQGALLARYGGREAALARGDLNYTPAPGQAPDMN